MTACFNYTFSCPVSPLPSDIFLCINTELLVREPCVTALGLEASISELICECNGPCGHTWIYSICYDETLITRELTVEDIEGFYFKGCLSDWVEYIFSQVEDPPGILPLQLKQAIYGSGVDGNLTVPAGQTWYLHGEGFFSRTFFNDTLLIEAGATLHPWGDYTLNPDGPSYVPPANPDPWYQRTEDSWPEGTAIFHKMCALNLVVSGTLSNDGASDLAANNENADMGTSGYQSTGYTGGNGAVGITPAVKGQPSLTSNVGYEPFLGGHGGAAGKGGGVGGANGGSYSFSAYSYQNAVKVKLEQLYRHLVFYANIREDMFISGDGGLGGGGGGITGAGATGGKGGRGGVSGGPIYICAKNITINPGGVISSKGGKGEAGYAGVSGGGQSAHGGGGGGGGGGGCIILVYETLTNNGTIDVSAGAGGDGGAGDGPLGEAGAPGGAGEEGIVIKFNLLTNKFE